MRELFFVRGLKQPRHLLSNSEGVLWVAPNDAIYKIAELERQGEFDELPPTTGDRVRLRNSVAWSAIDMLVQKSDARTIELLAPLFGGVRATAKAADLARAS